MREAKLCDSDDPPYTISELMQILHLDDDGTLRLWRKTGEGPPFFRKGRKHSRVFYPRSSFWQWFEEHVQANRGR